MPLAPGISNSLAIFARSVTLFSFSSARLMLMCLVPSIELLAQNLRPGLGFIPAPGRSNSRHAGILLIATGPNYFQLRFGLAHSPFIPSVRSGTLSWSNFDLPSPEAQILEQLPEL